MSTLNPGPGGTPDPQNPRDPYHDGRGTNRGWGLAWWWWVVAILLLLLIVWWAAFGAGAYDRDDAIDPAPTSTMPAP